MLREEAGIWAGDVVDVLAIALGPAYLSVGNPEAGAVIMERKANNHAPLVKQVGHTTPSLCPAWQSLDLALLLSFRTYDLIRTRVSMLPSVLLAKIVAS